tara:strand:- start:99 stop:458 length:360 start_codon:yes stop_codon:yes gene_type:complete
MFVQHVLHYCRSAWQDYGVLPVEPNCKSADFRRCFTVTAAHDPAGFIARHHKSRFGKNRFERRKTAPHNGTEHQILWVKRISTTNYPLKICESMHFILPTRKQAMLDVVLSTQEEHYQL